MLDNELIALVISTIIAQEAYANIPNTPIKQAFQPTQQGVNTDPTAYMFKVGDRRIGSPYRADVWNVSCSSMEHTELQKYETQFQISVLSTQDPTNTSQYTASDILNLIAYILQSSTTIAALEAQEIGILRIEQVRNPAFIDDRQRYEFHPSLDFTLTHNQAIMTTVPVLETTELQIYRV